MSADKISPERRSWNMSRIRGRDTKPELLVRRYLHTRGFRYSLFPKLPGRPDIALRKFKTVIFVHGCFWHCHGCSNSVMPKTNPGFWREKLERNVARDAENEAKLAEAGWRVIVVWECEIARDFEQTMKRITDQLN